MSNLTFLNSTEEVDARMAHLKILMAVVPIVVPIIFTLVIIIGFIGNLLVVLVVIFDKTMRNTTNILIFNLAVSNMGIMVRCYNRERYHKHTYLLTFLENYVSNFGIHNNIRVGSKCDMNGEL